MKKCKILLPLLLLLAALCLLASCALTDSPETEKTKIEGITFPDNSFNYDGKTEYSLSILGDLPEGVSVIYTGNGQVEYGTYTVHAIFVAAEGYEDLYELPAPMTATMTIKYKDTREKLLGIGFVSASYAYDGEPHGIEINGTLPDGIKVEYENNYQTDVGTYQVTASFTYTEEAAKKYQPLENIVATLIITPLTYDMSGIEYENTTVEYDGLPKSLLLSGDLADTLNVFYSYTDKDGNVYHDHDEDGHPVEGFGPTELGEYTFTVTFENTAVGCIAPSPMTAKLTIAEKAAKVTFMEGDTVNTVISVPFGAAFTQTLPTPKSEEAGYTFSWEDFDTSAITEDITVNIVKRATVYTLTFNAENGITLPSDLPTHYTVEDLPLALPTVESSTMPYAWRLMDDTASVLAVIPVGTIGNLSLVAVPTDSTLGIVYEVGEDGLTVKEYQGDDAYVFLPETYEGKPIVKIASGAFMGKEIKYIRIPHTVKVIGNNAFRDCTELSDIDLPSAIETIGVRAFAGCTSLRELVLSDTLTVIGLGAFEGTERLEAITLPFIGGSSTAKGGAANGWLGYIFGATNHMQNAAYVPASLKTVTVSKYCTRIEANAFDGLSGLESVILESDGTLGVRVISNEAFRGCTGLREIVIPMTVLEIPANTDAANSPFIGCSEELSIKIERPEAFVNSYFGQYFANVSETKKATVTYLA